MAPQLPPLVSPPHGQGHGPVTPQAVDKLVAAGLIQIMKSLEAFGQQAGTPEQSQKKEDSILAEVSTLLNSFGMQKCAKELGALKKEVVGLERSMTEKISEPFTLALKSQMSELNVQQNKAESMLANKAQIIAKSEKSCASLQDQFAELEKQIRNWNKRETVRQKLPERLEEERKSMAEETALIGKSDAWLAYEENEKKSKAQAKKLKRDRALIAELQETIFERNGERLKSISNLKSFMEKGCKEKLEKLTNEATQRQQKLLTDQEARERCSMECEDLRMRYANLKAQGRDSLKTSLARVIQIRELAGQKKEVIESLRKKRTEVAARSAEVAYAGWWWRSQLEAEHQKLKQRIHDSSPQQVESNIEKLDDFSEKLGHNTEATLKKAKASLLKQEVYFRKKDGFATRVLDLQRRQFFEAHWQEVQGADREVELETLTADMLKLQATKQAQIVALKQELARLLAVGDDQQVKHELQMQLKQLSEQTMRVESQVSWLERAERIIATGKASVD